MSSLSKFREIRACGTSIPRARECWAEEDEENEDEEGYSRHFLLFEIPGAAVPNLIWGALAQDLGIRPRIVGKIHVADMKKELLVHPYDGRGMDVLSTDAGLMQKLFEQFNA